MGHKLWGSLGVLASVLAGVGAAGAADMAVPAPVYKAPPPVMLSDWAGFYLGINGGGGWANNSFDYSTANNQTASGGLFGGQAGYNWQYGSVVTGVEVDFDGANLSQTDMFGNSTKTNELASARARLGYTVLPSLLAYGTAGAGWGHTEVTCPTCGPFGTTDAVSQFGWVAGAGLEYKLWGPLIARGEYLHYGFGKESLPQVGDNLKTDVDVVRGGLSYKF